jgi:nitroimidazol reductase NimA-like FMN-containing flavoprotein (pyridoxamine 5'-phosphate oxidase superfamily)
MDVAAARAEALAFLKNHTAGVLATVSGENQPRASAVYYACDDTFNIYFLTLLDSRKFAAIKANPKVAFTIGTFDVPQTLQMEGMATEVQREDESSPHIAELAKVLTSNSTYYAPIARLNTATPALIWIRPTWIRWGNFASPESGSKNILIEIPVS